MNEKYQSDLIVLALATGFRGYVKDGKTWIMTLHKGQSLPFRINFEREDIFCGNEQKVLDIIDERLGTTGEPKGVLESRFNSIMTAFGDENHKFWDIAKQNLKKGE